MKKKYEPVKCIKREKFIEIRNTIASKSAICKSFGARWSPEEKIWTWESSKAHPTFNIDEFIDEYNKESYNKGSNAEYWAYRRQIDKLKNDIIIEKERWQQGKVPIDENSSEEEQITKRNVMLCPIRQDDVFVYSYGAFPCYCKICRVNKVFLHTDMDCERHHVVGYIIGKKEAVEKIMEHPPDPHLYNFYTDPIITLTKGRAITLYTFFKK